MAKKSKKIDTQDVLLLTLFILLVISNLIWLIIINDQRRQINQLGHDNFNTLVNVNGL